MKKIAVLRPVLVLAAMIAVSVSTVHATMALRLSDGNGNCIEVVAGGPPGASTCPGGGPAINAGTSTSGNGVILAPPLIIPGLINLSGTLGNWAISVTSGTTKPIIGSANAPRMDLGISSLVSSGPATVGNGGVLTIQWTDTDFFFVPGGAIASGGGTAHLGDTVTYQTFTDITNTPFGTSNPMTTISWPPFNGCGLDDVCSFSGNQSAGSIGTSPYSMMQQLTITAGGAGHAITGNFHVSIVPEPASIALFGGIVLLTATTVRRRFKRV